MGEAAGGGKGGGGSATQGPFTMGVSPFDQSMINQSTGLDVLATQNRYDQLGLGGSTMEGQDVANEQLMGQAATGQEQSQNVGNPALNPALQSPSQTSPASNLGSTLGGAIGKLI